MTKDQTPAHNTITVEKFAKRVAAAVCRFLDVSPPSSWKFLRSWSLTVPRFRLVFTCRRRNDSKGKIQTGGSALEGLRRGR